MADEAGDARSGDNSGEGDGGAGFGKARGKKRGDVGTGFAGVHADEDVGLGTFAAQIGAEGAAGGVKSGVVKRRGAGYAANSVGAEEFFGHGSG